MKYKLIFFYSERIDFYKDKSNDKLQGGRKNVDGEGFGGEILNDCEQLI